MRVLLVEDEVGLSGALKEIFQKNKICIDTVTTGTQGLDYAQSGVYDVVVLDLMLPEKDGITVLTELRKSKNNVPVLLLTAKDDVQDKVNGLNSGADDYMTKPFATEELLARVKALTRRKGDIKEAAQQFGDLVLNSSTCELSSSTSKVAVKLSLKEFQILQMLFENPHQIITKERIIEKIWGGDSEVEYNNVEVYISFIRRKLDFLKVQTQIRTARGIGYSLEDETTNVPCGDIISRQQK